MAEQVKEDLAERVKQVLDEKVRPALRTHGGDLEFVAITDDDRLVIRLRGACSNCPASRITVEETVATAVREVWPGLRSVEVETGIDAELLAQARAILAARKKG